MKQLNLLWSGREYYSLENCLVDIEGLVLKVQSTIVGRYEHKLYYVHYSLSTDARGHTTSLRIDVQHNDQLVRHELLKDASGTWKYNGRERAEFNGCIDVDIPVTPFTNTLPIRRLRLGQKETAVIQVIYCDLLSNRIHSVRQRYTMISDTSYHYENIPNDFEATITVDDDGLVVDYPQLFKREAAIRSNYDFRSIIL
ncbi:putative glycolipid-binding domain-containing protein [Chryseolinea sp. T2]|uniref:putative glycolipid-binding domain-containing protein n=1 Tax=Chryseolinea sp. T2 TaxID=3129255 RepID=UPI003077F314